MPVHFAGHFSNMKKLTVIAKKHNIILIEDAAQAHGARWDGDYAGGRSRGAGFSFQYSKNMTSGEGGIIVSDSGDFTEACWEYIWHGRKKGGIWYEHFKATSNYRMTEWQAAVLLAQLDRLSEQNNIRDLNGKFLDRELGKIEGIESLKVSPLTEIHPRHLYIFRIKDKDIPKERFIKALNAEGIPALPGYGFPLYKNPAFLGKGMDYSKVYNENSEAACKEVVWILHNALLGTEEDMLDIVNAVKKIMANKDEL
jgi:dTDP-4-amino-4,6-dideoxygalactose transaminase